MNILVRIQDGIVVEKIEAPFVPAFHPLLQWVTVTDVSPRPEEGWSYQQDTGTFLPPAAPDPVEAPPETTGD